MLPNMKFYVISIVAIFTALGLGIYIGFSMDTEGFITDQQENLVNIVETEFENIREENKVLTVENQSLSDKSRNKNRYIDESYELLVPDKLENKNIALIETNRDYVTSSIGYDFEKAGANVLSLTTIDNISEMETKGLVRAIYKGEGLGSLENTKLISTLGNYKLQPDYIIICGGSRDESSSNVMSIDKAIVEEARILGIQVLGVEKSYVGNSYINRYKEYGISTVDNVDMKMGKIAAVLALNSNRGSFGIKGLSENILPNI